MVHLTILRDNREQRGWDFESFDATVSDETLETGDYTLAEFCQYDHGLDTYYPTFAVERKNGNDLVSSLTRNIDRFRREVKRASDWEHELVVLIEEPRTKIKRNRGFMQHRGVDPGQILQTQDTFEKYYNVKFEFTGTRERAQQRAVDLLSAELKRRLL